MLLIDPKGADLDYRPKSVAVVMTSLMAHDGSMPEDSPVYMNPSLKTSA